MAIRTWWSAGTKAKLDLNLAVEDSNRNSGGSELAATQTSFWSDFKRRQDASASPAGPDRAVKPLSILVPTDFAPSSLLALDCALRMAAQQTARITLLHAIHLNLLPYGPANVAALKTELCREALAKAEPVLVSAREMGVTAVCMLEEGPPAKVIAGASRRCAPDLVIMAGSRRGMFARWFGRGTVHRVIRTAGCPVLVLPSF